MRNVRLLCSQYFEKRHRYLGVFELLVGLDSGNNLAFYDSSNLKIVKLIDLKGLEIKNEIVSIETKSDDEMSIRTNEEEY